MFMSVTPKERLENLLEGKQKTLNSLKAEYEAAQAAVIANPGADQAAMKAAALKMQVEAAQMAVEAVERELQAELDRLNSPEAKKDLARLEKLNKEGLALTDELTGKLHALLADIKRWEQINNEGRSLAARYGQKAFSLGLASSRLTAVGLAITRWSQEVKAAEYYKKQTEELRAQAAKKPKKTIIPNSRDEMMKRRYPER